jgi:hypothetical protein
LRTSISAAARTLLPTGAKGYIKGIERLLDEAPEDPSPLNPKAVIPHAVFADVHEPNVSARRPSRKLKCSSDCITIYLIVVVHSSPFTGVSTTQDFKRKLHGPFQQERIA